MQCIASCEKIRMSWESALAELDERREKALLGGGAAKIEKQHAQGKLTARERIEVLLDKGTFVEVDGFVESRIDDFDLDKSCLLYTSPSPRD